MSDTQGVKFETTIIEGTVENPPKPTRLQFSREITDRFLRYLGPDVVERLGHDFVSEEDWGDKFSLACSLVAAMAADGVMDEPDRVIVMEALRKAFDIPRPTIRFKNQTGGPGLRVEPVLGTFVDADGRRFDTSEIDRKARHG